MFQHFQWPSYHQDLITVQTCSTVYYTHMNSIIDQSNTFFFFFNKAFSEYSSYSTVHPKFTVPAYLTLHCSNGRTVVIYRSRVHTSTDTYLHIQEAPVSYALQSQNLCCTLRRCAIFSKAQPLNIWLKVIIIICSVKNCSECVAIYKCTFQTHLTYISWIWESY